MESLEGFLTHFGYGGITLVLLIAGLGVPIPEDVPLLIAGLMCGEGWTDLRLMIPLCIAAVFAGDSMLYGIGRRYGHHIPRLPFLKNYLTPVRLARAEKSFHDHGGKTLFAARFMPGVRAALFFTAGTFRIPFSKMVIYDGGAALLSVPAWIVLGWFFHDQLPALKLWIEEAKLGAGITIGALVAAFIVWKLVRRRRRRLQAEAEEILALATPPLEPTVPAPTPAGQER